MTRVPGPSLRTSLPPERRLGLCAPHFFPWPPRHLDNSMWRINQMIPRCRPFHARRLGYDTGLEGQSGPLALIAPYLPGLKQNPSPSPACSCSRFYLLQTLGLANSSAQTFRWFPLPKVPKSASTCSQLQSGRSLFHLVEFPLLQTNTSPFSFLCTLWFPTLAVLWSHLWSF